MCLIECLVECLVECLMLHCGHKEMAAAYDGHSAKRIKTDEVNFFCHVDCDKMIPFLCFRTEIITNHILVTRIPGIQGHQPGIINCIDYYTLDFWGSTHNWTGGRTRKILIKYDLNDVHLFGVSHTLYQQVCILKLVSLIILCSQLTIVYSIINLFCVYLL